ncbi:MGH1-like glycoside hydrolase domain-containing protein [Autumnicola musiva]|uniref:Trehalase family glycosidase n=1 Tax=Autumnicola musiva TaxID=3075589 RepID=A0ABU3D7Q1_9FLAO|nr:glycosyl hydrolase family 65 protein [Zunongwangia sp. F117]MDT0677562.1 trehalase family glycosidase [Zunongwangia sp. F117]
MNLRYIKLFSILFFLSFISFSCDTENGAEEQQTSSKAFILKANDFQNYAEKFNNMEGENIVQAIPNDSSWNWMQKNIPLFETSQKSFEEMYYYRWWTARKHIKETPEGYAITEFLVERSYADKFNLISCALSHHIHEFRWLHNKDYIDQNVHVWFRGNEGENMEKLRSFSSWTASSLYDKYLVDQNEEYLLDMFPDLVEEYKAWEGDRRRDDGLFWQYDVKDGMEESLSGGRHVKNARPTINSYMYGNAKALAEMARMKGDEELAATFEAKADTLKQLVEEKLWNAKDQFFETFTENDTCANVREAIGFIPWYFNLPDENSKYNEAWKQVKNEEGFLAPFGLTTAERRSPRFRSHGTGTCEWDGAVWPFATSQTMTALANFMNNYDQDIVEKEDYYQLMDRYVESQYYRGRPYIGEYLDESTGYWLMGDRERSRYYNHSTFNDLVITGLVGLRPRADEKIEVNPLVPEDQWDYFCLDNVLYHGDILTIIWDKTGDKYNKGKGLKIFRNGEEIASSENLGHLISS